MSKIMKVKRARFHTGVYMLGTTLSGVDADKNKVEMYRLADGSLYVHQPEPFVTDKIISSGNLVDLDVEKPSDK